MATVLLLRSALHLVRIDGSEWALRAALNELSVAWRMNNAERVPGARRLIARVRNWIRADLRKLEAAR